MKWFNRQARSSIIFAASRFPVLHGIYLPLESAGQLLIPPAYAWIGDSRFWPELAGFMAVKMPRDCRDDHDSNALAAAIRTSAGLI